MNKSHLVFSRILAILATLLAIGGFTGHCWAVPITITNPGFEDTNATLVGVQGISNGVKVALPTTGAVGVWIRSGTTSAYFYNPGASMFDAPYNTAGSAAPEGVNVLRHESGSNRYVYQTLSDALVAGGTYVLQVMVGNRIGTGFPSGSVDLWAGGSLLARATVDDVGSPNFLISNDGAWVNVSLTYAALTGSPLLGQPLQIRLYATDKEIDFDNVRLDLNGTGAATVPEPATMLLLGSGLIGVAGLARRKLRKSTQVTQ
jgi:hypothetical protein